MSDLLIVDLGCGSCTLEGAIGVDIREDVGADIVHDINKGLPFDDESVCTLYASHVIEHLDDIDFVFTEMFRVCAPRAHVHIIVPYVQHQMTFTPGHQHHIAPFFLNVMGWDNSNLKSFLNHFDVVECFMTHEERGRSLVKKHFPDMPIEDAAYLFWNVGAHVNLICKPLKEEKA